MTAVSGAHCAGLAAVVVPVSPQPTRLLLSAWLQPKSWFQRAVVSQNVNEPAPDAGGHWPLFECDIKSPGPAHTCQPSEHRSATLQPAPSITAPVLPA